MTEVNIVNMGSELVVVTPFSREFPAAARKIGGNWVASTKAWSFDLRDEQAVKELCRQVFGTAGAEDEAELVTVGIKLDELAPEHFSSLGGSHFVNRIHWCGRTLAERRGRDKDVELGDKVRLLTGDWDPYGGSMANPALGSVEGIELEVRDVPKLMFDRLTNRDGVIVLNTAVDRDALQAERMQLLARLAEINVILGDATGEQR